MKLAGAHILLFAVNSGDPAMQLGFLLPVGIIVCEGNKGQPFNSQRETGVIVEMGSNVKLATRVLW